MSQIVISKRKAGVETRGGYHKLPYVFTEQGIAHLARCPSAGIATVASPFPHRRPSRRLGRDKRGPSRKWYSNCFAIVLVRSRFAVRAPCAHQRQSNASHKAKRFHKRAGHSPGPRKACASRNPFPPRQRRAKRAAGEMISRANKPPQPPRRGRIPRKPNNTRGCGAVPKTGPKTAKNFFQFFFKTPLRTFRQCDTLAAVQRPD